MVSSVELVLCVILLVWGMEAGLYVARILTVGFRVLQMALYVYRNVKV